MAGFLRRTLDVIISWRSLSIFPCKMMKFISSILEAESAREGDLSSKSKDEIELMLLMLDIEDVDSSEPLLLAERGKG